MLLTWSHCRAGLAALCLWTTIGLLPTRAQSITPATDGTATLVTPDGNRIEISGGKLSGDQTNLFHSFEKFGLNSNEVANFLSNPQVQNILGRVVGGDASVINGLIQVTGGNSNLFLINPAGMIFGPDASLNVPADFTATTANGIQIGQDWFSAIGDNNYAALSGKPNAFAFTTSELGSILNAGELAVEQGQSLNLVGGTVINTGTLSAPGGKITVAAVPGEKLVRISQAGSLLSLELPIETKATLNANTQTFSPLSLPELLTGGKVSVATGVTVKNGVVQLTSSGTEIPADAGTAIASGKIDASASQSQQTGGKVNVLGEKVGVISSNINTSGSKGGGTVLVGGDYQGKGTVQNAARTYVSNDSVIKADAWQSGNGGKVIVWSDENTGFDGTITARGGVLSGDGGFVEVSGKENLIFRGMVYANATNGEAGTLLLDPKNIIISTISNSFNYSVSPNLFLADAPATTSSNLTVSDPGTISDLNVFLNLNHTFTRDLRISLSNGAKTVVLFNRAGGSGDNIRNVTFDDAATSPINNFLPDYGGGTYQTDSTGSPRLLSAFNGQPVGGTWTLSSQDLAGGDVGTLLTWGISGTATGTGSPVASNAQFAENAGSTTTITPESITAITNAGTAVRLQANNDISVNSAIISNNPSGNGGDLALQAGRSILLNADITTDNGNLALSANDPGAIAAQRDPGAAAITMAPGTTIDAGTGNVNMTLGAGNSSGITLSNIATTGNLNLDSSSAVTQTEGSAITASSLNLLGTGSYTLTNPTNDIATLLGNTTGDISYSNATDVALAASTIGGSFNITALTGGISSNGDITVGSDITFTGDTLVLNAPVASAGAGTLTLQPLTPSRNIGIGTTTGEFDLSSTTLNNLVDGFNQIVIGRADGAGIVTLDNSVANEGATFFKDPVNIAGGSTLVGSDLINTWNITGIDQGDLNSSFSNGLTFNNIQNLTGGSSGDTFRLNGGSVANIDGGAGNNTIVGDNTNNTWNITSTNAGDVNGTTAFTNIQNLTGGNADDTFIFGDNLFLVPLADYSLDGSADDTFIFNDAASISGTLNEGEGFDTGDTFSLNGGSVANIDGGAGNNTIVGDNTNNTWNMTNTNAGDVNGTTAFTNIQNLTGGSEYDTFIFSDGASISGILDGAEGFDTLDYSAYTTAIAVDLEANTATGTAGVFNIENVVFPAEPQPTPAEPQPTPEPELTPAEPQPTPEPELTPAEPQPTPEPELTPAEPQPTPEPEPTPTEPQPTPEPELTPAEPQPTPEPDTTNSREGLSPEQAVEIIPSLQPNTSTATEATPPNNSEETPLLCAIRSGSVQPIDQYQGLPECVAN